MVKYRHMVFFDWGNKKEDVPAAMGKLSEVLKERGYVYQHSSELEEITDQKVRTVYLGIDPSADSLHVGNLQAMLVLRRFLEHGHKVILLIGGGTGMIGDPSGKSEERNLLDDATIDRNARAIGAQGAKLFGGRNFTLMNNAEWLRQLNYIEFLRDVGKYFSVNAMLARDSVKDRLANQEQGISYTEFSYMLLQSYDFLHLYTKHGCDVQIGASDQWGNILSGVDLIRRKTGKVAYALTSPLLINKSTGKKFGKSESGAVWLDANKTSVFDFYQFWINSSDADVEEYLLKMTLVPKAVIDAVMEEQRHNPAGRAAQRVLAWEVTALVHGTNEADKAKQAAEAAFSGGGEVGEGVPTAVIKKGESLRVALKDQVASTNELRRLVEGNAIAEVGAHGQRFSDINTPIERTMVIHIGKRRLVKIEVK